MSFIGPRPLPTYYAPYFYKKEWARHKVRGGLIPPDSLSHKVFTTWEEQFEYEVYYSIVGERDINSMKTLWIMQFRIRR